MWLLSILFVLLATSNATVLTLSGGELTINGAISSTYIDLFMNFTANVQWVAMIWSQNQADTDVTLFKINAVNPAIPVTLVDCYIDQNSYIQTDNIQNLMSSTTGYKGDITNGISAAFKRDLSTGDLKDITIYPNSIIQVCFICSTQVFVGNGKEIGNEKSCAYISLHKNVNNLQDRLLGNFAATATLGGANLTVYATASTDGGSYQSWLFVTVILKALGQNPYSPKWLGILYSNTLTNNDLAIIQYNTEGGSLDVHIGDYYSVSNTNANTDRSFIINQGNNDLKVVMTAYDSAAYIVGSYKRKFQTGDLNRDIIVTNGNNTFCFIYGSSLAFSSFSQPQQVCKNFNLVTQYTSAFRKTSSSSVVVTPYTAPTTNVAVLTVAHQKHLISILAFLLLISIY